MLSTKIATYKKYLISDKELKELEGKKVENFISFLKRKYSKFEVDKILNESALQFKDLNLVIEKTINKLFFRIQKSLLKYAKVTNPELSFLIKYLLAYLKIEDLKLIAPFVLKGKLSEEEKKELIAHLISDKLIKYLSKDEFKKFLAKYNFKTNSDDFVVVINEFNKYILLKLKRYSKGKVVDLIIANYNYNLKKKEELLKINLRKYFIGNKVINNKDFERKIKTLLRNGKKEDKLIAFILNLNFEKRKLLKILHSLKKE